MADLYHQLLDATIQHLEELKSEGVRFVSVSPEAVAGLTAPGAKAPVRAGAPASHVPRPAPRLAPTAPGKPVAAPGARIQPASATSAAAPAAPRPGALSPEAKAAAFAALRERVLPCTKCPHLVAGRHNVVFGVGDIQAKLMFVGEAPGADEDIQGEPFVGRAGQLLTKIIVAMGLTRHTVYIGNILKCRPDTPGQSSGNRKPTAEEMQVCLPYLQEQIDLIQPQVLVALGATAVEGLLGKTAGITRLRGHWQSYRGIPLMPTYHPAFLLRNASNSEKRLVWEDMLQVMERLQMSISEKQRNYFLPKSA